MRQKFIFSENLYFVWRPDRRERVRDTAGTLAAEEASLPRTALDEEQLNRSDGPPLWEYA